MSQPSSEQNPAESTEQIAAVLADTYGLSGVELNRVPAGQVTINYRAQAQGQRLFIKQYTAEADMTAETDAILQTQWAGEHGVPVAAIVPSTTGEAISHHSGIALSVWEWVPGNTVDTGLSSQQQTAAGKVLGRIHRAFASHPVNALSSPRLEQWHNPDLAKINATIDHLLKVLDKRTTHDSFDKKAEETLVERRTMLRHVSGLLDGLPPLACQVLHGDYSAVNLLFDGDELTAVVDFRPPEPFLTGYELGRIAFDPRTVVFNDNWIASGVDLITAYLEENPNLAVADIQACARIALIQLIVSLYGVKQHYLTPGLLQNDLDAFWLLRHRAAQRLLGSLDEVESALKTITTRGTNIS